MVHAELEMSPAHLQSHNLYVLIFLVLIEFFPPLSFDCRALDGGRCVAACAKGKYQSGGQCHLCDHACATCVDAGPDNCTSCDTGMAVC